MTALLSDVLTEVATVARLDGIKQSFPFPPQDITPPSVYVMVDESEIVTFNNGVLDVSFNLFLFTSSQVDRAGYEKVIAYGDAEGDLSLMAAINGANGFDTDGQNIFNSRLRSVHVSCLGWRFLNQQEVDGLEAYGAVYGGLIRITRE